MHPANKRPFLAHIHYFRAFAIINIVLVHTWVAPSEFSDRADAHLLNLIREIAFHDATLYFIFISGFMFSYLSPKFTLARYYHSKLVTVISPYILMTMLVLVARAMPDVLGGSFDLGAFLASLWHALLTGSAQVQFWYIPFIAVVFLVSPLLLRIPRRWIGAVTLVAALLPLLGTRTGSTLALGQYIYFFPVYMIGAYAAMDYASFSALIRRWMPLLVVLAVLSTVWLIWLAGAVPTWGPLNGSESLFYVQKMSICLIALILFQSLEAHDLKLVSLFATYSFSIYFLHLLVEFGPVKLFWFEQVDAFAPQAMIPAAFVFALGVAFATLAVSMLLKRLFGRYSRYVIGA
ncbi:acyltransferase family protein [Thiohalocapsa marina]|uniref:acyltransferase family protein n=1 Tax=Thiohalocapsa marina TaxID=424902 RepID=UPI0014791C9F|nr:acyltransferase [Thiohalocapsa marina]